LHARINCCRQHWRRIGSRPLSLVRTREYGSSQSLRKSRNSLACKVVAPDVCSLMIEQSHSFSFSLVKGSALIPTCVRLVVVALLLHSGPVYIRIILAGSEQAYRPNPQRSSLAEAPTLKPGETAQRQIKGGKSQSLTISASAGQLIQLAIEQH